MGKAADLRLRADVPSLDAVAELFATGAESEKTLRLELVQRESPGEDPGPGASSEAGTVNGEIRFGSDPEQTMPITATIDHRYADGWHISQMLRPFRAYLESPAAFEPELEATAGPPPA